MFQASAPLLIPVRRPWAEASTLTPTRSLDVIGASTDVQFAIRAYGEERKARKTKKEKNEVRLFFIGNWFDFKILEILGIYRVPSRNLKLTKVLL